MRNINPLFILLGGLGLLILLLHERARFVTALVVFLVVALSAAEVVGVDLKFWK